MSGLKWRGKEVEKLIRDTAMQALHNGMEHIITEAIDETPIKSGTLRRSAAVTDAPGEDTVYGSFNTPYAVRQHEDLTLKHTDGKAKYLEDPFNRNKTRVEKMAGDRIRQVLQGVR